MLKFFSVVQVGIPVGTWVEAPKVGEFLRLQLAARVPPAAADRRQAPAVPRRQPVGSLDALDT